VIACLRRFLFAGFVDNDASPRFRLRAETRPGMCVATHTAGTRDDA